MRFVKAGTNDTTDRLTNKLVAFWDEIEAKIDLSLPVRLAASLSDLDSSIKDELKSVGGEGREISTAERLLWGREGELRQFGIQSYNSYREPWTSDAALVRAIVSEVPIDIVEIGAPSWEEQVEEILAKKAIVALTSDGEMRTLVKAIVGLLSKPVTVGYHNFYPMIDAYKEGEAGEAEVIIALREKL